MNVLDTPVRAFKNHRLGCYTIVRGTGVVACARQVRLEDVEFLVRESGRRRMLERGRRTIHAYAVGRLLSYVRLDEPEDLTPVVGRRAAYDPHRFGYFYDRETEAPLAGARFVQLDAQGIVYSGGHPLETARAA